jgi:chromosome segregation ATPase
MATPLGWQINVPATLAARDRDIAALTKELKEERAKYQALQKRLCSGTALALTAENEALAATHVTEMTALAAKAKGINDALTARIMALQAEADRLTDRNKFLEALDESHAKIIREYKIFETQAKIFETQANAATKRADEAFKRYKRKFTDAWNALTEARTANAPLKQEVAALSAALATQKATADALLDETSHAVAVRDATIEDLRREVTSARANIANAMNEGSSLDLKLTEATATISSLRATTDHLYRERDLAVAEKQARIDELQAKLDEAKLAQAKQDEIDARAPKRKRSAPSRFSPE